MAKEIMFYQSFSNWSAEDMHEYLEKANGEDIVIRLNSPGGSVFAGYGIISMLQEYKGKVTVKIDGVAASMAAIFLLFADEVIGQDVSKIMFHRGDMYTHSDEQRVFLNKVNEDIKSLLLKKVDADKFEAVSGTSIETMFDNNIERKDVWLSAKQAKEIGILTKIIDITNQKEIEAYGMFDVAAIYDPKNQEQKTVKMDLQKLKADHPELVQAIVAEATASEKDRIQAILISCQGNMEIANKAIDENRNLSAVEKATIDIAEREKLRADLNNDDSTPPSQTPQPQPSNDGLSEEMKAMLQSKGAIS